MGALDVNSSSDEEVDDVRVFVSGDGEEHDDGDLFGDPDEDLAVESSSDEEDDESDAPGDSE